MHFTEWFPDQQVMLMAPAPAFDLRALIIWLLEALALPDPLVYSLV